MNNSEGTFLQRLSSRKFLSVAIAAVVVILNELFNWNLSKDAITSLIFLVLGYVGVEGTKDVVTEIRKNNVG